MNFDRFFRIRTIAALALVFHGLPSVGISQPRALPSNLNTNVAVTDQLAVSKGTTPVSVPSIANVNSNLIAVSPVGNDASEIDANSAEPKYSRFSAPIYKANEGFFRKDAAQTIFDEKVSWKEQPPLEYFPALRAADSEEITEAQAAETITKTKEEVGKKFLPTAEAILKEYGDPAEDTPVLAQPDAPAPFKGLMAALQIGDEKLAYKFARQWSRYNSNLNNRTLKVTGLTGLAMKREGQLEDGTWADDPQFKQYRHLMEDDLREQETEKAKNSQDALIAQLDGKARELLNRARDDEEMGKTAVPATTVKNGFTNMTNPQDEEQIERQAIRAELAGKVPVDSKGKVDVFFFLKLRDNNSLAMAPAIEALFRSVVKEGRTTFTALSLDGVSDAEIRAFRGKTGTTFPITQGDMMAQAFGVKTAPTSVFMTTTTNEVVTNQGVKNFFYLDELLKAMRGGRQ